VPFGRLWYGEPSAVSNTKFRSRSHDAVIRVYDAAVNDRMRILPERDATGAAAVFGEAAALE